MTIVNSQSALALAEGFGLAFPPCILPILSFILAASAVGNRRSCKPAGCAGLRGRYPMVQQRSADDGAYDKGAGLRLNFTAGKTYLVLGTASGQPVTAMVTLNGAPVGAAAGADAPNGTASATGISSMN